MLEILLATAMAAVLLLSLWSLFSIYTNLFETGQKKAETSQLVRALMSQLADDLHSAIQDPIPGTPTATRTSTPLRRFGLFGSQHELRLDILQVTPLQGNPTPVSDSDEFLEEPSAPRVPELRTVYYTFREPLLPDDVDVDTETLPGLVRRELDFETPQAEGPDSGFAGERIGLDTLENETPGDARPGEPSSPGAPAPQPVDDSVIWVPEVVRLEFRYFDGNGWTGQWNSLARRSLPVAVEVALQLRSVAEPEPGGLEESTEIGDAMEEPLASELAGPLAPPREGPIYRLVVDLPGSPEHAAPKKIRPVPVSPPPRPVTRRVAPPRGPASTPAVRTLPDEWMRTQP